MNNKVPLDQVLKDMYTNSGVESAARDYYYREYATDEERKQMDREDRINSMISGCITVFIIAAAIISFTNIMIGP